MICLKLIFTDDWSIQYKKRKIKWCNANKKKKIKNTRIKQKITQKILIYIYMMTVKF